MRSTNRHSFRRSLKRKGFKEEIVIKIGLYDLVTSTTLESNKSLGYISDAHDQHGVAGEIHATRGPGEADYVQQLQNYDEAFGKFFDRLAAAGINTSNTLFVFTVEEGDHFVGSQPTPVDCDGVHTPCTYSLVGEVNGNLAGL